MADWPLLEGQRAEVTTMANAAAGTIITASATAHTKGSYTQIIASTAFAAKHVLVLTQDAGTGSDTLIDVAVGAAASEQVIFSNLSLCSGNGLGTGVFQYSFPVCVPASSRLAARSQSSTVSLATRINCILLSSGFLPSQPLSQVETIGANTADSGGTSIDPGATANTKGSYTQIVASTGFPYRALLIATPNQVNTVRTAARYSLDVVVGAAASETIVVPDYMFNASSVSDTVAPGVSPLIPVSIPAGSRVAVRAASSTADATDRLFDVIIYGVG